MALREIRTVQSPGGYLSSQVGPRFIGSDRFID